MISDGNGNAFVYNALNNTFVQNSKTGIDSCTVTAGGSSYTAPTIVFTDPTGSGATATVQISGGVVTGITMLTHGQNYTNPSYTISDATGSGATITILTDQFLGADTLTYQDGLAVFNVPNLNLFQTSQAGDFTLYDSASSAQITSWQGPVVAVVQYKRSLWVFNDRGAELWWNAGTLPLSFQRQDGNLITQGLAAKYSIVAMDNTLIWLSRNTYGAGIVVMWNGFSVNAISTHAVNAAINTYSTITDAFAYAFYSRGSVFYVLTFPTANKTWVYNTYTQTWNEWNTLAANSLPGEPKVQGRHISNCYSYCYGLNLVGDYQSGNIYQLDENTYTDNGNTIIRERASKYTFENNRLISIFNFQITLEQGIGNENSPGDNPQVMLQVSKDNGRTWSQELWRSAGKVGLYTYRCLWTSLGMSRSWIFRIKVSDPNKWVVIGANADVEMGDN